MIQLPFPPGNFFNIDICSSSTRSYFISKVIQLVQAVKLQWIIYIWFSKIFTYLGGITLVSDDPIPILLQVQHSCYLVALVNIALNSSESVVSASPKETKVFIVMYPEGYTRTFGNITPLKVVSLFSCPLGFKQNQTISTINYLCICHHNLKISFDNNIIL